MCAFSISNFLTLIFSACLVVAAFLTFLAICAQVWIYNCQLKEMQKSSQAAAEAAQAAKASADAATQAVNTSMVTERAIVLIDSVTLNTDKLRYESVVLFTL